MINMVITLLYYTAVFYAPIANSVFRIEKVIK